MPHRTDTGFVISEPNPRASSSLVPMLVAGIVLTIAGMLAAVLFI